MFRSFFRYLKGYLKIRIKGYSPERFVNLCKYKGIEIWDLKYNLDSYEMYISVSDFRKLKPLLKKTVTKVLILERLGFPFFLYHYRKRKLFFVGIAVCILFVYMMTLFLWRIEIEGNQRITNDVILEYLETKQIHYGMKMKEIQRLYSTLHEASEDKFVEVADKILKRNITITKLQKIRKDCGYSQSELAELSDVNKRMIQQYETGAKDINKAAGVTLLALAKVLGCEVEDLLEI